MQTVYNRSTENWTSIVEKIKIHTIHNTFKIKQKYFYSRPSKWTPGLVYSLLQVHNSRKQLGNASPRKVIWPWLKSLEVANRYRHYTPEARTGTAKPAKQCASCISIRVLSFLLSTKVPVMLLFSIVEFSSVFEYFIARSLARNTFLLSHMRCFLPSPRWPAFRKSPRRPLMIAAVAHQTWLRQQQHY